MATTTENTTGDVDATEPDEYAVAGRAVLAARAEYDAAAAAYADAVSALGDAPRFGAELDADRDRVYQATTARSAARDRLDVARADLRRAEANRSNARAERSQVRPPHTEDLFTVYDNQREEVGKFGDLNDARAAARTNDGFVVTGAIVFESDSED